MKLDARRIARFLENPGPCKAVLLHGSDGGLIRARGIALVRLVGGAADDPFRIAVLEPARHAALAEEASALSLTGGRRVVRVREATDALTPIVAAHLDSTTTTLLVLEAAELPPRSKLRAALEAHPDAAAIGCYPEEGRALEATIRAELDSAKVRIGPEAMTLLVSLLGQDQGQTRSELQKLALYCGPGTEADLAAIQACIGDAASLSVDEALYAATAGEMEHADRALSLAVAEGAAPVAVVRAALIHLQKLHRARAAMASGKSASEAMAALRPPIFFRRQPAFQRSLSLWPMPALEEALAHLFAAELACKKTGAPDQVIAQGVVMRIAMRAASRGARR